MAPVLKVAALVLGEVTKDVFPNAFGRLNLSAKWPSLHKFLGDVVRSSRNNTEFEVVCNDLVESFNSLPIERIEQAVEFVFLAYFERRQTDHPENFVFTVHDKQKFSEGRVLRGKPRPFRNAVMRQVEVRDVRKVVGLSLQLAKFTSLGRCFKQKRGSPIGNQISPALCDLTVSVEEAMWLKAFQVLKESSRAMCWFGRYVDNRFLIFPRAYLHADAFQVLVSPTFYRHPVVLEACDPGELLGCLVDMDTCTVEFRIPKEAWQYRAAKSAGSGG